MVDRHTIWRLLVYLAFLVAMVAGRGCLVAWMAAGRYPFDALCFDVVALALLMAVLHLLDRGLQAAVRKAWRSGPRWRETIVQAVRLPFVLLVLFPFLIVTLSVHPQRIACTADPLAYGLKFERVALDSDGIYLDAWYIPGANESGPVVLVAHGVGANKQNFLPAADRLHAQGYSVLIFDFRAHGDTGGFVTSYGMREAQDVKVAYDWLAARHPGRPICAVGYSMGGAAVARAAYEHGIFDKIVLDSTFSSFRSMAQRRILRYFGPLDSLAWRQGCFWAWLWTGAEFEKNAVASYSPVLADKPLLLIHGKNDSVIPLTESVRIWKSFGMRPQLWLVEGAGHVETMSAPDYETRIRTFFERCEIDPRVTPSADRDVTADDSLVGRENSVRLGRGPIRNSP